MRRFITFIAALAMATAALVAPAQAAPPAIIGLDQLRTLLNDQGPIQGYFLTVAGGPSLADQTPQQVKMTVLAVADKTGPDGALIMFRADMSDPVMQGLGGIAAGMSGSPLFIDDGSGPKMIGALSYGYMFTVDGLGLATPVEYMLATQNDFPALSGSTLTVDRPVRIQGRTIRRVLLTTSGTDSPRADTVTARPLFGIHIKGVPPSSGAYKRFARAAAEKGTMVLAGGNGQCTQGGFTAPYTEGGSIGAYYTLGSAEVGGYGTVTYVDGSTVMAFGHPMDWAGKTDLFATNVWVSGIWGSIAEPFKVGCAGQLQGAVTQDRSAAIGVDLNATTQSTPATADVRITTDVTRSAAGSTQIAAGTFTAGYGPAAADLAVAEPVYRVANQAAMQGSSRTTTVVGVTDGIDTFTITRPNVFSGVDVLGTTGMDAASIVATALSVPGVPARVTSIHVDADIDQLSRTAAITGVRGGPLQVGQNTLNVTVKPTGKPPVTVPVTFTVPSGLVLDGGVAVEAGSGYFTSDEGEAPNAESLSEIVEWINDVPTNDQIVVSLPDSNGNPVVVGRTSTDYYLEGAQYPSAVAGSLVAEAPSVLLGDPVNLLAMPSGLAAGTPITLSERVAGSSDWQTVATEPVDITSDGTAAAVFSVSPSANTTYRASWPGDDNLLAWAAEAEVTVSPPLNLQGSRRGNAWQVEVTSAPQAAGVSVVLQARRDGAWAPVGNGVLSAEGTASLQWRTGPQSARVRVVTDATPRLAAGSSDPVTLTSTSLVVNPDAKPRPAGNVTIGLRNPSGAPITGATFRVQRKAGDGWEQAARATLRKSSRLWLANGDYRVTVPQQKGVPAQVRQSFTVSSATIVIRSVTGGRGRARLVALPPIPLRFTVQKQQAGQWLPVGGVRHMAPPKMSWTRQVKPGRYRFAFPTQNGFQAAVSGAVRVR